jgi:hypothetical protein
VGTWFSLSESESEGGSSPSGCRGSGGPVGVGGGGRGGADTTQCMIGRGSLEKDRVGLEGTVWMVDPKRNLWVRGSGVSGL